MGSGTRLLLLWIIVALLWVIPIRFFARNAAIFTLWPALLYLALVVGISLFALVLTIQWLAAGPNMPLHVDEEPGILP